MDREQVQRRETQRIQEQLPVSVAACPVRVDAHKPAERAASGDLKAGLAVPASAVPLPRILAHICDHPCQSQRRRSDSGDSIGIGALDRACAEFGSLATPARPEAPKNRRAAVVGGGLSGVAAAIGLAKRGYAISLFEARPQLLGRMRLLDEDVLPAHIIDADLSVLDNLGVAMHCEALIGPFGLDILLEQYDALYLAAGPDAFCPDGSGIDFLGFARSEDGKVQIDPLTLATSHSKVFAGGAQRYSPAAYSPIASIADGNYAAVSIDQYLQGALEQALEDN